MTSQIHFFRWLRLSASGLLLSALVLFLSEHVWAQTPKPDLWIANNNVGTIANDSTHTYIGGLFQIVGPATGNGAKLTTTSTVPEMNFPKPNGIIYAATSDGSGGWYIGGNFSAVGTTTRANVARILANGSVDVTWNPAPNNTVNTIAVDGNDIYIGGAFTSIGGQTRNRIGKVNNTTGTADLSWDANSNNYVNSITINGSDVYVGGAFTNIGGQNRNRITRLNKTTGAADSWDPNSNDIVSTIVINGSNIYVGGDFTTFGTSPAVTRNRIARLDITSGIPDAWDPNAQNNVRAIAVSGNDIYVGGFFGGIGGQTRGRIAKLDGTTGLADLSWNPNANNSVLTIAISGSDVYVGGQFVNIAGQIGNYIVKLNNSTGAFDSTWRPNAFSTVNVIAINGSDMYVGGHFKSIGGLIRNRIARLTKTTGAIDSTWNPNSGNIVNTIAISGSDIYVGGTFIAIGGQARNRIAKLNNTNGDADPAWNPNAGNGVSTIAVNGNDIYVGGSFTTFGTSPAVTRNRIAKLNNTNGSPDPTWNPDANGVVNTIAISGSDIYAGGDFTTINSQARNRIAKLNNTNGAPDPTWNPDANEEVRTIAISGNDLHAGGFFTAIGGQTRNSVARLDNITGAADVNWDPNVSGNGGGVQTIAFSGSSVFLGGFFSSVSGVGRFRLAQVSYTTGALNNWNPAPNSHVRALAVDGTDIYIGGDFDQIAGVQYQRIYRALVPTYTWTGSVSNDWNTAGNWDLNTVPSNTNEVFIPSGTPFAPNLNHTTFTVTDFTQNAGQTLNLGSGNLNITGSFTNNGTIAGSGKVVLNGTSAQTISGTGTVTNLEINHSSGATVRAGAADTLKVTRLLTLTTGTLNTNNKLKLKSTTSSQAAMVGPIPVSGAGISGNVIHERYLSAPGNGSGGRSWRLLTSPLANNTASRSIFYHWQNNGVNDGTGIELFSPSGTGATGNGLTQGGVNPSIRTYDAATNIYQNVTNTKTTNLFTGIRNNTFLAFVSGHYGSGNITGGSGITNADATGTLVTGTQTYNFTPPNATNIYYLMGNPYACPIDFDDVYNNAGTQNINRMFWVIDPNLSNVGAYVTVTYTGGTYVTSAGNQNQYIQTGQGFFVEGNSVGNQSAVVIEENDKETSAAQTPMFRTNGGSLETFRIKLFKNINSVSTLLDGTVVAGHQNTSNAIDSEDGVKFGNFNENISIWKGNNIRLAIEGRQLLDNNDTVSMALSNMQQTAYQLEFEPGNMNVPGLSATLIDNFANTITPISLSSNTSYAFTVTSNAASTGNDRFKVVFNNTTPLAVQFVNVRAEKKESAVQVNWTVNVQQGIKTYDVERSSDGKVFEKIASLTADAKADYSFTDQAPINGNNYYRIKAIARSSNGVYSNIARVNLNQINASLSSYPNPAKGSNLQISISNLNEGNYIICLYNAAGQKAGSTQIRYEGGSSQINMNIEHLVPGIYIMQLMNEQGDAIAEQQIVRQ